MQAIPRPEHPRPQLKREPWINLNGTWSYEIDHTDSGYDQAEYATAGVGARGESDHRSRRLWLSQGFEQKITVPFCPESSLSGVGHTDFIEVMWYHRPITRPLDWKERVWLHFGAVDYHCEVFLGGQLVGRHAGGQCGFSVDITGVINPGQTLDLVLRVTDYLRRYTQPSGKQSTWHHSRGCHYTRVTGIWQTVWMESVPFAGLESIHIVPDLDQSAFYLTPHFHTPRPGHHLRATLLEKAKPVAEVTVPQVNGIPLTLSVAEPRLWSPESPFLYDLRLEVLDEHEHVVDTVHSYAGLRKIHWEEDRLFLNNQPLYLRLVLDQGYYPDGIWTAPSDEALRQDIELAMAAGFNGARLHQKVFEPRFHYWADRLGYLTWGESSSWGCNASSFEGRDNFLREWREIICRDRNHPSIIAWTPWNEMWWIQDELQFGRTLLDTYALTRALDPTRPVHTASGGAHCRTDIWSVHSYAQTAEALAEAINNRCDNNLKAARKKLLESTDYAGQPYLLTEFGGVKWHNRSDETSNPAWGYGDAPKTEEEFLHRLKALVDCIHAHPQLSGFCYTQLTDVEQETNGLYTYDRQPKFDMTLIKRIFD